MGYDLYPAVDQNHNFAPVILDALAKTLQLRHTIVPMTQAARNNLTGADLWDGRVIFNLDTNRLNSYETATTSWQEIANFVDLTKGNVGLGNVDNTSDANKPVSTAQSAAIAVETNARLADVDKLGGDHGGPYAGTGGVSMTKQYGITPHGSVPSWVRWRYLTADLVQVNLRFIAGIGEFTNWRATMTLSGLPGGHSSDSFVGMTGRLRNDDGSTTIMHGESTAGPNNTFLLVPNGGTAAAGYTAAIYAGSRFDMWFTYRAATSVA